MCRNSILISKIQHFIGQHVIPVRFKKELITIQTIYREKRSSDVSNKCTQNLISLKIT